MYNNSKNFSAEVIKWPDNQGVKLELLPDKDINNVWFFKVWGRISCQSYVDNLLLNSICILVNGDKSLRSIKTFNSKINMIQQLEKMITKSNNELKAHKMKWTSEKKKQL